MNYAHHYERLIERSRNRILLVYKERHHVVPRCMGGDDSRSNIVELTAEEHYVAHQLLVKMYPGHTGLLWAANAMASGHQQRSNNKLYGWLRYRLARSLTGKKRDPEIVRRIGAAIRGRKLSPEHRALISKVLNGRKKTPGHREKLRVHLARLASSPVISAKRAAASRGNKYGLGKKRTPEAIERTAAAHRGKIVSMETRKKHADAIRGRPLSAEHRAKVSASLLGNTRSLGYKHTAETRAKMSESSRGRIRAPHSPESIAKMRATKIGKKRSMDSRMKQSLAMRGVPKSPEHRAALAEANRRRARHNASLSTSSSHWR